jgi:formate/nitrite transporter FocA (FNT family)
MEHSIANMFYLSAAFMQVDCNAEVKTGDCHNYVYLRSLNGISTNYTYPGDYPSYGDFVGRNLIPVTLGNMIGGFALGLLFWFAYLWPKSKTE